MIFESHAHFDDSRFDVDRNEILGNIGKNGLDIVINVGASMKMNERTIEMAHEFPRVYAAIGMHPSELGTKREDTMEWLRTNAVDEKVVAIGEIGLDYYWVKEPNLRMEQKEWFRKQLSLAKETKLPVIIHSRDAAKETLELMREEHAEEIPGVVHCYSYSVENAFDYIQMGYYIGVGGVVTFNNAKTLKEVVRQIPLQRILLETDCPYMAPEPYRGKRNSSLYLPYIIEKIAEIKNISPEEVEKVTRENGYLLFSKIKKPEID